MIRTIRLLAGLAFLASLTCWSAPSITFIEPGTDATGDFAFYSSTAGTVASDTTVSKTGPRSIKCSTGSPAVTASVTTPVGILADAGRRTSLWVRVSGTPAAISRLLGFANSVGTAVFQIRLNASRILTVQPIGATEVVGSTVLAANTWYRLSISYVIANSTTWRIQLYLNGVPEVNANSNGTLTTVSSSRIALASNSVFGVNFDTWFDDIVTDDGADYSDPGDIRVTAKRPAANNVNNYDTAVGNNPANRWENVNEVPISIVNGWQQLAIADTQENYGLQGAAIGDVDISAYPLLGRTAWIWAKETAVLGTPKIMDNGTETGITLTTSPALYTVTTTSASYPSNAAGIGMRSAATAAGTFLYECGTVIAYMAPGSRNGDFNTGF